MPNTAPDASEPVHVGVAAVCRGEDVLVARRPLDKHQGGLLEFPGGKVEPGESVCQALVRELAEEVAITADPAAMAPLIRVRYDYPDKSVLLDVWKVSAFSGTPQGLEGQPVQWLAVDRLRDEDFPAANRPIIRALRVPREWLITGPWDGADALAARLDQALSLQPGSGLILRQPRVEPEQYLALARQALSLCQERGVPMLLHGAPALLQHLPEAHGVHLPQSQARRLSPGELPPGKWLGVSCHSPAELAAAATIGADYALLSPVCPTRSHPGQPGLGWDQFADWVEPAALPVYALGGMTRQAQSVVRRCGGQGIAGIGYWWGGGE